MKNLSNNFLETINLSIGYKNQDLLINNINIKLKSTDFLVVLGKSGSGKTSFLKSLTNSIDNINGDILFNKENILKLKKNQQKVYLTKIGFLTQISNLVFEDTVYTNIKRSFFQYKNWFYKLFSIITKDQKQQIFDVLNKLKIIEKVFINVSELSGGEIQRMEIAKLILQKSELVLADEPISSLDINNADNIMQILQKITKENNLITIVNSHNINHAKKYATKILWFKNKQAYYFENSKNVTLKILKSIYDDN